jgi:hypothetical protein
MLKALAFFPFAVVAFGQSAGFGGGNACVMQFSSLGIENCSTTLLSGLTIGPVVGPFQVANSSGYAGLVAEVGNTTVPISLPVNSSGWLGPNSPSFTSYFFQPSSTAPSASGFMIAGAASSNVVPVTFGPSVSFAATFSANGAASAPGLTISGAPYSGGSTTTNFPQLYLNSGASGPTTFSTAGTEFGISAVNGFTGNFFDFYVNGGTSQASITYTGLLTLNSAIIAGGDIQTAGGKAFRFGAAGSGRDILTSPADGELEATGTAGNTTAFTTAAGTGYLCYSTSTFLLTIEATTCGSSLAKFKENIQPLTHGLDYVMQMRPVTFDWRQDSGHQPDPLMNMHDLGMIADETAAIDPLLGVYDRTKDGNAELSNWKDRGVLATAIAAIQELKKENDSLRARIEALELR